MPYWGKAADEMIGSYCRKTGQGSEDIAYAAKELLIAKEFGYKLAEWKCLGELEKMLHRKTLQLKSRSTIFDIAFRDKMRNG